MKTLLVLLYLFTLAPGVVAAQPSPPPADTQTEEAQRDPPAAPERVDVTPRAGDGQIGERLKLILAATGWFEQATVRVEQGVVFLEGRTRQERHREWASALAQRTEGVVAVVNDIEVAGAELTDLSPALEGLEALVSASARTMPFMIVGVLLLVLAYLAGRSTTWAFRASVRRRKQPDLIRELTARAVGILVLPWGSIWR